MTHKFYDSRDHESAQNKKIREIQRHEKKEDKAQLIDEKAQDAELTRQNVEMKRQDTDFLKHVEEQKASLLSLDARLVTLETATPGTGQGPKGDKGDQGIQGEKGEQGVQGERGDQGLPGSVIDVEQKFLAYELTVAERFAAVSKRIDELTVAPGIVR